MATHRLPILGAMTVPDTTGEAFFEPIDSALTIGNNMKQLVLTLKDPTADTGVYGSFHVPQNYVGTPKIIVAVIEGAASTGNMGFEFSYKAVADGESVDAAWDESSAWTLAGDNVAEQLTETSDTLTANFAVADEVQFYFKRDFSGDTFSGDLHVMGLYFEYSDA